MPIFPCYVIRDMYKHNVLHCNCFVLEYKEAVPFSDSLKEMICTVKLFDGFQSLCSAATVCVLRRIVCTEIRDMPVDITSFVNSSHPSMLTLLLTFYISTRPSDHRFLFTTA
jgi:hypothetical protein